MDKIIVAKRPNKVVYIEDNKCFKVFDVAYNIGDILSEALNQARILETDLNVPALLGVTSIDNKWAIITENIKGKTLEQLMDEDPSNIDIYLERFVDIQINMQSKRCPLLSRHHDKMNRKVSATDLSSTLRYDLHNRIEEKPKNNYLCHGDYNPSNVIIDDNDKAYIIDWSHATTGNREADSARTFLLFLLDNKNELAKKYMKLYCDKTSCNYVDILNWLPILAASQSVKGKKDESQLLYKLIFMDEKGLIDYYEKI